MEGEEGVDEGLRVQGLVARLVRALLFVVAAGMLVLLVELEVQVFVFIRHHYIFFDSIISIFGTSDTSRLFDGLDRLLRKLTLFAFFHFLAFTSRVITLVGVEVVVEIEGFLLSNRLIILAGLHFVNNNC